MRRHRRFTLGLIVSGLCQGACVGASDIASFECISFNDCDPGEACLLGSCLSVGSHSQSVYVDLTPSNSSGFAPQPVTNLRDLSLSARQSFVLKTTMRHTGQVLWSDGSAASGVLSAAPVDLGPSDNGTPVRLPSSRGLTQSAVADGAFTLTLVPGLYSLRFEPLGPDGTPNGPPISWQSLMLDEETPKLELTYPEPDQWVRVSGQVQATATLFSPVEGALISGSAISSQSGVALQSTTAITDGNGAYTLLFPPNAEELSVTVRPGNELGLNSLVPTATRELTRVLPQDGNSPATLEPLVLDLPSGGAKSFSAQLRSQQGDPVVNAVVRFRGEVGIGIFEAEGRTDANGNLAQQPLLLPGRYTVNIAPENNSAQALSVTEICFFPDDPSQGSACEPDSLWQPSMVLTVVDRITINGTINGPDGLPVSDAKILFNRMDAPIRRESSASANSLGHYSARIDPPFENDTVQLMTSIEPVLRPSRPLAFHHQVLTITATQLMDTPTLLWDFTLPPAALVFGVITNDEGIAQPEVRVALYSATAGSPDSPLLIGLGRTNEQGEYVVAIEAE